MARRGRAARRILALALAAAALPALAADPFEDTMAQRLKACTGCHGADGRAAADGYHPRLAGKPAGYLYRQLVAFRDGQRRYAPMALLLAPLDDRYLRDIAAHFAALDLPPPAPRPAAVLDAARQRRAQTLVRQGDPALALPACTGCHGAALTGAGDDVPGLLGLSADYLNAQLGAWRQGTRRAAPPDCMAQIARRLAPADIDALSRWLAGQPLPASAREPAPTRPPLDCGSLPRDPEGRR